MTWVAEDKRCSSYVNRHAIHVCALQRSGHHAVIQWILVNSMVGQARVCFLNNCAPQSNPYVTATARESLLFGADLTAERSGRWAHKDLLVCNYEDCMPLEVYPNWFDDSMAGWIGPSARITNVLVLRDPFNLIASKCRWAIGPVRDMKSVRLGGVLTDHWRHRLLRLPSLWKAHAREFLRVTSFMPDPTVPVNYNRWFCDAGYRRELAVALGISDGDEGRRLVARWGPNTWGASFDDLSYDGRADEMNIYDRWKYFIDDDFYRLLCCDHELLALSALVFGRTAAHEELVG